MSDKIDFKKTLESYRAKRGEFRLLEVPEMTYLMVDGQGDPNGGGEYARALEALYPVAYKLKFASKRELGRDYVVPPLEGLWWADDMDSFTVSRDKSVWRWTMMIMVPEWIDNAMFDTVARGLGGKNAPEMLGSVRFASLAEGLCAQTLHVGSFDDEAPILEELHEQFIPSAGLAMRGTHHEVYFSDPRKTAPERMRTLLRQPVERIDSDDSVARATES